MFREAPVIGMTIQGIVRVINWNNLVLATAKSVSTSMQ